MTDETTDGGDADLPDDREDDHEENHDQGASMERQDGVSREVGGERRSESGEVHAGEYGDPPQYFDPAAETSDELPRSPEGSRSEMIGQRGTEGRSPIATRIDEEASAHAGLKRARKVANALDSAVTVPGTSFEVGLDPILGILPGGGDAVAALGSLYIVLEAARAGVPRSALQKMLALVVVDLVAGSVPVVGVAFDAVWKANEWNVATFEEHLDGDAR